MCDQRSLLEQYFPALDANRYVIEELKKRVPIWKLELYRDGTREWVGAGSVMSGDTVDAPHGSVADATEVAQ